ncbi:hypothetical protein [Isoptericola sediminis]|uniref:EVE domain-containing protein n=1 Tax=Isoptericola sediminis TaxID=2733572 RepID=A0A849K7Z6_9MICO|nr:hypothetical protein [Isoptericola sediminis]NNU27317.1 hypothetical protein [Isoptericola sediminis]
MTSYLLVVGDRVALGWILTEHRTAFPSRGRSEVAALEPGDELFVYTTRGCFKNPTRDRGRIVGTARVAGPVERLEEPVTFGDRTFPFGCPLDVGPLAPFGDGIELAPLVDRLAAFDGAGSAWSIRLRRPLVRLSDDDAVQLRSKIARRVGPGNEAPYTRWWLRHRG